MINVTDIPGELYEPMSQIQQVLLSKRGIQETNDGTCGAHLRIVGACGRSDSIEILPALYARSLELTFYLIAAPVAPCHV